ncbi:hypothetical protein QVD17_22618 [Tagetes erecta]|uniref:eRF1/Pelota-like N-terminal domain-containing protein n=1 Tax=Tagetes erecta TaxID=13708 RepID=A0AAD8NLT3_TARER|nr:hypothetical protein QVD17_22618 [Tagetes erecta]
MPEATDDKDIEISRIKEFIEELKAARGIHSSLISVIIPPYAETSHFIRMLNSDLHTALRINSVLQRQFVLSSISSVRRSLSCHSRVPPNGLVLYTGTILTAERIQQRFTICFQPFKPINASLYLRGNKFDTEALNELLESDDNKFGFIVMDENRTLFGSLSGDTRRVLHKFVVDDDGGLGVGLYNHVRKTAEMAKQIFINPVTGQPNVSGLILAGPDVYFNIKSDMFDPRLRAKILNVVHVSYGGENGFNQAIELSIVTLANAKLILEKRLLVKYFNEVFEDTKKYVVGVDDTLKCLEMGAVETLIVWDNLGINRYVLKNSTTGEIFVKHLNKKQEGDQRNFRDADTNAELKVEEKMPFCEWLANEYKHFRCTLEFVTNKSREGSQFSKGFGGIGGILRYKLGTRSVGDLSNDGEICESDYQSKTTCARGVGADQSQHRGTR